LDVVVESTVLELVLVKQSVSILVPEVFKLDQSVLTEALDTSAHEVVNELVVFFSTGALPAQSNVKRIFEELLKIRINHVKITKIDLPRYPYRRPA
jgi:hypothetical protein